MEQTNQGAQNFLNNNGMSVEEAYKHVQTWYKEGKYAEVIDGCQEIMQYVPDYQNIKQLLADAQNAQNKQNFSAELKTNAEMSAIPTQQTILEEAQQNSPQNTNSSKNEDYKVAVAQDEKIVSAIGYLSFLCILPLLLGKDSKYCQHHGKQGLVLVIIFFFYKFISIFAFLPFLEAPIQFFLRIGDILWLTVIVMAIIQAYRGSMWKIPVVYKMSEQLKF